MDLKTHCLSIFHVMMGLNLKSDIKRVHSSPTCHCSVTFGYLGLCKMTVTGAKQKVKRRLLRRLL